MSTNEDEATISFPSIAIVAVLGFIIYRYFFSSTSAGGGGTTGTNGLSSASASSSTSRNGLFFTEAQVDQVHQMFPQIGRRDIMWDLQRNRGNVQATIERVLMGRSLEVAPPSFQPPMPTAPATSTSLSSRSAPGQVHPDLITRYNLQSRVESKGKEKEEEPATGWASTKEQRQTMLQRRRDEMILAARRKLQEKEAQNLQTLPSS